MNFLTILLALLFCYPIAVCASDDRERFLANYGVAQAELKLFALTSIEREIKVIEDSREVQFSLYALVFNKGANPMEGVDSVEALRARLNLIKQGELDWIASVARRLEASGGRLYMVELERDVSGEQAEGLLIIKDGVVLENFTVNSRGGALYVLRRVGEGAPE